MQIVKSPRQMQRLSTLARREGRRIGFVPTMGYLHEGHVSLVRRARREVGPDGLVAASIYVNPTQFAASEDLSQYPRDLRRDCQMCRAASVDVLFVPTDAAMYPGRAEGVFSTYVVEEALSQRMEGASRPTHFRGVTTIVAKLFNIVQPDVAILGAKDFQQAVVIRKMTQDLNFPIEIVVSPTVREKDGLAMSSRNKYLAPSERAEATILSRCLQEARKIVRRRGKIVADQLREQLAGMIQMSPGARLDYVEFFEPSTLTPVAEVRKGAHMALAVFFGQTRLIDNGRL